MLRQATETDEGFIVNSWMRSFAGAQRAVSLSVYNRYQHKLIERLMCECSIAVYCNPDEPSQICGYIVYESPVVHWVFVKQPFRKLGIARKLLELVQPECGLRFYTHRTFATGFLETDNDVYNPYLISETK